MCLSTLQFYTINSTSVRYRRNFGARYTHKYRFGVKKIPPSTCLYSLLVGRDEFGRRKWITLPARATAAAAAVAATTWLNEYGRRVFTVVEEGRVPGMPGFSGISTASSAPVLPELPQAHVPNAAHPSPSIREQSGSAYRTFRFWRTCLNTSARCVRAAASPRL